MFGSLVFCSFVSRPDEASTAEIAHRSAGLGLGCDDGLAEGGAGQAQVNSERQKVEVCLHKSDWQEIAHRAIRSGANRGWRHPRSMGAAEEEAFLAHLAFRVLALRERDDSAPPLLEEAYSPLSIQTACPRP